MTLVFFETQDWEQKDLENAFPEAVFVSKKLDQSVATNYTSAEIISCFIYSTIDKSVIDAFPHLKCIVTRSTGYDHIDVAYCKKKGITVCNVPEYGSNTVAEHTFALILSLTRKIYQSVNQSKTLNFEHKEIRGTDLEHKTIGIIGMGKIGQHVLRIARGFGMKVLVFTQNKDLSLQKRYDFSYTDLHTLLRSSDVITLHLPLNKTTKHIINKENISLCKRDCYMINTARGGLIETEALVKGLDEGILAGVGLDVLEEERDLSEEAEILASEYKSHADLRNLIYDHMLINHPKVLITPHNAFNSIEALERITNTTVGNIQGFIGGKAQNTVL